MSDQLSEIENNSSHKTSAAILSRGYCHPGSIFDTVPVCITFGVATDKSTEE